MMNRRIVVLTEGYSNPRSAKTACSMIRYRPDEVVAVLDSTQAGKRAQELLQVGGDLPIVARLDEVPEANTLLIGIAPPGGKIPPAWRQVILEAITRGMEIVSGLHEFLADDPEFVHAAAQSGSPLWDIRKNHERTIATCQGFDESCFRVHTVGHDCSVGKMVTSLELTHGLKAQGIDAKFVATGQTGIMVEGDGLPIDCVVADFVSGAAEKLVLERQQHDLLIIEGQGSLVHPAYSAVTLGLLHGCAPHAMILCYEVGRTQTTSLEHRTIPPLEDVFRLFELMANARHPSRIIGISMNGRLLSESQADDEKRRVERQFGLPVCDVFRDGPQVLVDAVRQAAQAHRQRHPR